MKKKDSIYIDPLPLSMEEIPGEKMSGIIGGLPMIAVAIGISACTAVAIVMTTE